MPRSYRQRDSWREEHADEIRWLEDYSGHSSFLNSLRRQVLEGSGWLSEAQTEALQRNMRELPWPQVAAESTQAPEILNGEYQIQTEQYTTKYYQIYTVQGGALQGYRIIKRRDDNGVYRGFAFLSREDVDTQDQDEYIRVWRRFQEEFDRGEQHIMLAIVLVRALRDCRAVLRLRNGTDSFDYQGISGGRYEITFTRHCRYCNEVLENYDLIADGAHRQCRPVPLRDNSRTVAQPRATRRSNVSHDDINDTPLNQAEQDMEEEIERNRPQERINEDESSLLMSELGTGEVR